MSIKSEVFSIEGIEIPVRIDTEATGDYRVPSQWSRDRKGKWHDLRQYLLDHLQAGVGYVDMEFPDEKTAIHAANAARQMNYFGLSSRWRMKEGQVMRTHKVPKTIDPSNFSQSRTIRFWIDYKS